MRVLASALVSLQNHWGKLSTLILLAAILCGLHLLEWPRSIAEIQFDLELHRRRGIINAYYAQEKTVRGENPQYAFAKDYFEYYLAHRPSRVATKAVEQAFTMWGMLDRSSNLVDAAISKIRDDEDIWHVAIDGISNSYSKDKRFNSKFTFLTLYDQFLAKNLGPKSRLFIEFRSAEAEMDMGFSNRALLGFQRVLKNNNDSHFVKEAKLHIREIQLLQPGMSAPAFIAEDITRKKVSIEEHRGKIVLLFFWSANCGPCHRELPYLRDVALKHSGEVQIIGISGDSDGATLREKIREESLSWTHIAEDQWFFGPISSKYGVLRYPTIFILDKDGRIAAKHVRAEGIERAIRKLI